MITLAIHTYEKALALRALLESHGISVELSDVIHNSKDFTSGVRVRIPEDQLPLALKIVEGDLTAGFIGKKILVPVDFSEHSFKAVGVAASLAQRLDCALQLLYSYIDPYIAGNVQFSDTLSYEIGESGAREQMKENSHKMMRNFTERVSRTMAEGVFPRIPIESVVLEGVPEDSIIEYAKTEFPLLIVMGTRGSEQKSRELIGSVTGEVLDEGRFTVLTVPDPIDKSMVQNPETILFLGNLDQDDIIALDTLYRLYPGVHAKVILSYYCRRRRVSESLALTALKRLKTYCENNFSRFDFEISSLPKPGDDQIERLAKDSSCSLLVIPNHHRNAFSRLFRPRIANKILFQTDFPMLVIPK